MAKINHKEAEEQLHDSFDKAEKIWLANEQLALDGELDNHLDIVFSSGTRSYREALLGCCLAKLLDPSIDIRLPYVSHGEIAFSGRGLDERVVNPFLRQKQVPVSTGPYLNVFRRQVRFVPETREGLQDKVGYDSLVWLIDSLNEADNEFLISFLEASLFRFVQIREQANIPIAKPQRISLPQYKELLAHLLSVQSGGLLPVIFVVSTFRTIKEFYDLDWEITWQGINVADAASGTGGDVTIALNDSILMSIEITLRQVDKARMISTFNTKIAPSGVEDYLFLVGVTLPSQEAIEQADRYFSQGHEINFAEIVNWITMLLVSFGKPGRDLYGKNLVSMLEEPETPQAVKVAWNEAVNRLFTT